MGKENEIPKELEMRRATPDGKLSLLVCFTSNGRPPTPKKFANPSKAGDPPPWPQSLSEIQAPLSSAVWAKDVIGEKAGWPGKKRIFLTGSYDSTFGLQEVGDDHLTHPLAFFWCPLHPEPRQCTDQAEENASSRGSQRARGAEVSTTAFPSPSAATWWTPCHRHAVTPTSRRLVNLSSIPPSSTHHRAILARKQAPIYSPRQGDNQSEAKSHVRRVAVSQSLLLGARACPPLREAPAHPYTLAYGISQHLGSRHCWQSNSRQNLL